FPARHFYGFRSVNEARLGSRHNIARLDARMQIVCPSCATSYDLSPAALGNGRSVRCVRCRNVWFATPDAEPAAARAPEVAPDEPAAENPTPDDLQPNADGAPPAGEFDWSFSPAEMPAAGETANSPEAGAGGSAQDAVDALWSSAEAEAVAPKDAPPLVPAIEPETMQAA